MAAAGTCSIRRIRAMIMPVRSLPWVQWMRVGKGVSGLVRSSRVCFLLKRGVKGS